METVLSKLIKSVENGSNFKVDLKQKSIKVDKQYLIKEGVITDEALELFNHEDLKLCQYDVYHKYTEFEEVMERLEFLYIIYKNSIPSEKEDNQKKKVYFKANDLNKISEYHMIFGVPRRTARAILEGYLLCLILSGSLVWDSRYGNWFYQSKNDKDFVILKEWVVKK